MKKKSKFIQNLIINLSTHSVTHHLDKSSRLIKHFEFLPFRHIPNAKPPVHCTHSPTITPLPPILNPTGGTKRVLGWSSRTFLNPSSTEVIFLASLIDQNCDLSQNFSVYNMSARPTLGAITLKTGLMITAGFFFLLSDLVCS